MLAVLTMPLAMVSCSDEDSPLPGENGASEVESNIAFDENGENPVFVLGTPGELSALLKTYTDRPDTITRIKVDGIVGDEDFAVLHDMYALYHIDLSGARCVDNKIPANALSNRKITMHFFMPQDVEEIGESAFESAGLCNEVVLPETVKVIGDYAFADNYLWGEWSSYLPAGLTYLGAGAFSDNTLVKGTWTLPRGITEIAPSAFYACQGIKELVIPNHVTEIGASAFAWNNLEKIVIPGSVKKVGSRAFLNSRWVTEMELNDGLEEVGEWAFWNFESLERIYIPQTIKKLGARCFAGLRKAEGVEIPTLVTDFPEECFSYAYMAKGDLILPEGATHVGPNAFHAGGWDGKLVIPSTIESVEYGAFGIDCTEIEFHTTKLKKATMASFDLSKLNSTTFRIPEGVEEIEHEAFRHPYIKEMIFPTTLKVVDYELLEGMSYERIVMTAQEPPSVIRFYYGETQHTDDYPGFKCECPIVVPDEAVEAYKQSPYWKNCNIVTASQLDGSGLGINPLDPVPGVWD